LAAPVRRKALKKVARQALNSPPTGRSRLADDCVATS